MTTSATIAVAEIKINGGTQPRCEIDDSLVSEYAEAMREGAEFPPVVVFEDGVGFWLADGFHRTHAARRAGVEEIAAEVHQGTKRDAVLYSVGANSSHGKRRTPADKRKAVMTLLTNPEVANDPETGEPWSDREAARRCKVTHPFVAKVRASLTGNVSSDKPTTRTYTTKHGTTATMNTSNIGKRRDDADERVDEPEAAGTQQSAPAKSRGRGLEIAHEAIQVLHTIPHSDGLRQEAFDTVIQWIEANR